MAAAVAIFRRRLITAGCDSPKLAFGGEGSLRRCVSISRAAEFFGIRIVALAYSAEGRSGGSAADIGSFGGRQPIRGAEKTRLGE